MFKKQNSQNSSGRLLVMDVYLFSKPNSYCFSRAAQGQLSECNKRHTVTALRAKIKSHKVLKETEEFIKSCFIKKLF